MGSIGSKYDGIEMLDGPTCLSKYLFNNCSRLHLNIQILNKYLF